jgi:hypothetical protein
MALNIPLFRPGEAGAIGSQISPMLQQLMQQRFKPQELELQRQAEARQQAAAGRAAQLFPMQKQMQELQLQALRRQVDPQAQMDYYQQLQQMYGQQPQADTQQPAPQMPTQPMGEGMGMFPADTVPESLPSPQSSPVAQQRQDAVIQTPIGMMTPQQAQGMLMAGIKFPGVEQQLKRHFEGEKAASPLGKAVSDLERLRKSGAPDNQIKQMEDYVQRLAEGTPGMQLSVDPATGAVSFSTGRGQRSLQQQVIDGKVVTQPTTATMTAYQKQQLASKAREEALEHIEQPYLGFGGTFAMINDLNTYKTSPDPKLREAAADRLVKAAVSEKIVPEVAALQLNSQGVQATVHALEKQEGSIRLGWPQFGKKITDNLPPELQKKANDEHNNRLKELTGIREKYFIEGMPVDARAPDKPAAPEQAEQMVTVINPQGQRFTTPASNAQNLPEGWKRG